MWQKTLDFLWRLIFLCFSLVTVLHMLKVEALPASFKVLLLYPCIWAFLFIIFHALKIAGNHNLWSACPQVLYILARSIILWDTGYQCFSCWAGKGKHCTCFSWLVHLRRKFLISLSSDVRLNHTQGRSCSWVARLFAFYDSDALPITQKGGLQCHPCRYSPSSCISEVK